MFYSYYKFKPIISPKAYIHPEAVIIGNVTVEENVYIGPCAVLRGDWGKIVVKKGANVQENCVVHVFPNIDAILEENSHVGHGAIIHGAIIKHNAMIGMNAVVMDGAIIEENCIVGALSFVPTNFKCNKNELIVGSPAKVVKKISKSMIDWKSAGTKNYQELAKEGKKAIRQCRPLTKYKKQTMTKVIDYHIWKKK